MPLDPSIPLAAKGPRIEYNPINPINAMLQGEQLRGAQQANALRQLQMQQSQREMEQKEVLNRLLVGAMSPEGDLDYGKAMSALAGAGMGEQLPELAERRDRTRLKQAQIAAAQAEQQRKAIGEAIGFLNRADEQNYPALRQFMVQMAPGLERLLPTTYNKSSIDALAGKMQEQAKVLTGSPGSQFVRKDPTTGTITVLHTVPTKPAEQGAPRTQRVELSDYSIGLMNMDTGEITRATVGGEPAKARPPATPREPSPPSLTQIQDPTDPSRMITIDARRYQGGGMGSPGVIGTTGKTAPAAAAASKRDEGVAQARDILDTLRTAYDTLDRERAVPSQARNILSNALSYVAGTGAGQVAGRIAGTEAQTQRDIIQSARNQMLNAVKNATGMSAQQLNSNIEFRSWLESLSDPTRSIEANRAILDNLEKFIASGGTFSAKTEAVPSVRGKPTGGLTPQEQKELERLRAKHSGAQK